MFGSKQAKQERLSRELDLMRQRGEVTRSQLARELNVSFDAIEDDLATLHEHSALLCERKGKLSLFERWFGKR